MSNISVTNTSYDTGGIDTRSNLDGTSRATFQQINGVAGAVIAVETILGDGPTLKGVMTDLVARLALTLNSNGTLKLTGFQGLTQDFGLTASSSTTLQVMNHTPIGVVQPYAGSTAPSNWLLCDGSEVSRTSFVKLFGVVGTTYGVGNGTTTFNVPDLRGRTVIMKDGGASRITSASTNGTNGNTLGGVGGAETHTLTLAQTPAHDHAGLATLKSSNAGGSNQAVGIVADATAPGGDTSFSESVTLTSNGGGTAHSNTQPWIALQYIIFTGV